MKTDVIYAIKIDGEIHETESPTLTGKELLRIAGKRPPGEHIIYLLLEGGDMESIRENETVDLERQGIEKFKTFRTDVIYRISVNGNSREWGADFITGRVIKRLAGIDHPNEFGVWQQIKGKDDRLIADRESVDLSEDGIERFRVGSKFSVCIEGKVFEWPKKTITTEEIIQLGGWDASQGTVEVDKDQNERTLETDEIINLKPGHNFCKKQRFKRGLDYESRIGQEFELLQKHFNHVEYKEVESVHWFKITGYLLPPPLSPENIKVVFSVTAGHPVPKPYGFFVPKGIKIDSTLLSLEAPPHSPPFEGNWLFVSWDPENWSPGVDITSGDNLWGWARSFRSRLQEGE